MAYDLDDRLVGIGFDDDTWPNADATEIEIDRGSRREGRAEQRQGLFFQGLRIHSSLFACTRMTLTDDDGKPLLIERHPVDVVGLNLGEPIPISSASASSAVSMSLCASDRTLSVTPG